MYSLIPFTLLFSLPLVHAGIVPRINAGDDSSESALDEGMDTIDYTGTFTGSGTWFDVTGTGEVACGGDVNGGELLVAVTQAFFDGYPGASPDNSDGNPICGKKILATYNGKSVKAAIVDACATLGTCEYPHLYHVDFSKAAFEALADLSVGELKDVSWSLVSPPGGSSSSSSSDSGDDSGSDDDSSSSSSKTKTKTHTPTHTSTPTPTSTHHAKTHAQTSSVDDTPSSTSSSAAASSTKGSSGNSVCNKRKRRSTNKRRSTKRDLHRAAILARSHYSHQL